MIRSSTNEIFTPYKYPKREFRSSRRHFKTLSLDELRSFDFNLFSDQENLEEEEAETMAETMEQYMSKTRADYGSGVVRPKIEEKYNFELKDQFLKKLRTNTFSGSDHEDANDHIEKVLKIVDLFHIPNITIDQVMLRAFLMSLTGAASQWLRNKPTGSIRTWEYLKTKFLSKYCPPARTAKKMEEINNFQQEPDENLYQAWERFKDLLMKYPQLKSAYHQKTAADAKTTIQEIDEYSQKWNNGTSRVISTETSYGLVAIQAQLNNLGREIKKVNEKVYAAQVGCEQCKGPYYTKDCPLKEEGKTLEEAYYTQFGKPFQGGGYIATAPGFYQRNNANPSCCHLKPRKLIVKTLEIQIGQMSKVLQERGFGSLPSSTETNPRDHVKSISTIVEADASSICPYSYGASHIDKSIPQKEKDSRSFTLPCYINNVCFDNALPDLGTSVSVMPLSTYLNLRLGELAHTKLTVKLADKTVNYPKGIAENVLVGIGKFVFPVDFIILDMPEDIKVTLILERPFLSTANAKIDVFKRNITLRVGEEKIIFKSVKPSSSLIKRVYMLSLRERIELDLEARLMGETLVLNRSLDPFFEDYIKLNDLNVLICMDIAKITRKEPKTGQKTNTRRKEYTRAGNYQALVNKNQVDDLMPTIEEGEAVEEFRARNVAKLVSEIFGYPSDCDHDKKICIDYAHNLKFSCMIDFAILEDMDTYRDEGMDDVIFGEPFLREVRINARRFEGMITIRNGNEEVTYQMVRSHPRTSLQRNRRILVKDLQSRNLEVLES
ncbi:hypothetical protein Tco_1079655 [Tanacetum coccineum]|uniref:Retrotransposon gag domain-containing protein n=1 Tax=Tanacetum coccineum TaxID=301880 RepID=A0ABQ5HTZ3_9ASTR